MDTTDPSQVLAKTDSASKLSSSEEIPNKRIKTFATKHSAPVAHSDSGTFTIFSKLPIEIRARIWEKAITPRIIRCNRTNDENIFTAISKSLPLIKVCRESREAAFLYGGYILLRTSPYIYFSPKIDYLYFDVGWEPLTPRLFPPTPPKRPCNFVETLEAINPGLKMLRNIMVHPSWSDERMKPTVPLAQFPQLDRLLVSSDEKSIGPRSNVMFDAVHDLRMYYVAVKKQNPNINIPWIAVGCLGWTGADRWAIHHGSRDNRQLVAVFQDYAAMKEHQRLLREEEKRFTQERFASRPPSFMLKLRLAREAYESGSIPRLNAASAVIKSSSSIPSPEVVPRPEITPAAEVLPTSQAAAPPVSVPALPPTYDDATSQDTTNASHIAPS